MRILGVDPGTLHLGYGLVEESAGQARASDYGSLDFQSTLPIEQRLYQIHSHLLNMIGMFNPDEIAIEEPFLGRGDNQYVGPAFAIGQAQAAVLIAAASQGIPVFRYSPAQIKSSVANYGAASKAQVQTMVRLALSMEQEPDSPDAADALATAFCHLQQRGLKELLNRQADPGGSSEYDSGR